MKLNRLTILSVCVSLGSFLWSCDNDGDIIYTSGPDDITLSGNDTDIVLQADALDALVLTLYWNDNGTLTTSDPKVDAPLNVTRNTIELASDAVFSNKVEISVTDGVYEYQMTARELNGYLSKLGFIAGQSTPLYIRVSGKIADNISPKYSDVLTVNVTPYHIDTTVGFYLNTSMEQIHELYSPEDNGVYRGFIGAGAWENWWLREGDGTTWGNDGVSGTPFVISSASTSWNFWYPGVSGCYYTIVDTRKNEWSALLIESLTVGGDLSGEMIYDRKANQWSMHISEGSGNVNITVTGSAKQYNVATGTDDGAAVATQVAFSGNPESILFESGNISLNLSGGECDLILDLNDPRQWTLTTGTVAPPAEGPAEILWVVGHNDGITGGWNFDSWLRLYNEDNSTYGGVLDINSLWGYKFYKEENNWEESWGMVDGGTGYEGQLLMNDGSNITAPDPGLYLADVSLSGLTYKLTLINSVHYTGLNDDWSLTAMNATDQPGVYTATVTKSANTPWGVKILINESWDLAFGGGDGFLRLYQDGFDGDNDLDNGEYTLTVNLCEGTYSYSK